MADPLNNTPIQVSRPSLNLPSVVGLRRTNLRLAFPILSSPPTGSTTSISPHHTGSTTSISPHHTGSTTSIPPHQTGSTTFLPPHSTPTTNFILHNPQQLIERQHRPSGGFSISANSKNNTLGFLSPALSNMNLNNTSSAAAPSAVAAATVLSNVVPPPQPAVAVTPVTTTNTSSLLEQKYTPSRDEASSSLSHLDRDKGHRSSLRKNNKTPKRMVRGVCGSPDFWSQQMSNTRQSPSPRREISIQLLNKKDSDLSLRKSSWSPNRSARFHKLPETSSSSNPEKAMSLPIKNQKYKDFHRVNADKNVLEQESNKSPYGGGGIIDKWGNSLSPPHPPRCSKKVTSLTNSSESCTKTHQNLCRAESPFTVGCSVENPSLIKDQPRGTSNAPVMRLSSGSSSDSEKEEKKRQLVLHLPPSGGGTLPHRPAATSPSPSEVLRERSRKR